MRLLSPIIEVTEASVFLALNGHVITVKPGNRRDKVLAVFPFWHPIVTLRCVSQTKFMTDCDKESCIYLLHMYYTIFFIYCIF